MKTCSIIITFNPEIEEFHDYLLTNIKEVDYSIIVDNSTNIEIAKKLSIYDEYENVKFIQLNENTGIANAQNVGIKYAEDKGIFDFVLFLDQDSRLKEGTVSTYYKYYEKLKKDYKIACLGVGDTGYKNSNSEPYCEVNQIISSGSFVPISVFKDIGNMDKNLFIDFVEYDWCWRAKSKGYSIIQIKEISLIHKSGDGKLNILGKYMVVPSPIRHYYQYRNFLILLHESYVPLLWKIKNFIKMSVKIILYFILLDKKILRLKFIIKGILSYIKNEKGIYK